MAYILSVSRNHNWKLMKIYSTPYPQGVAEIEISEALQMARWNAQGRTAYRSTRWDLESAGLSDQGNLFVKKWHSPLLMCENASRGSMYRDSQSQLPGNANQMNHTYYIYL